MRASLVAMVTAFVLIAGGTAVAAPSQQDIGGTWQGTLPVGQQLRVVIQISKAADGALTATMYSIDQSPNPIPVSSMKLDGEKVSFTVDALRGTFIHFHQFSPTLGPIVIVTMAVGFFVVALYNFRRA